MGPPTALPNLDGETAVLPVKRSGERNKRPWIVRWSLDGRQRSRAFRTKAEAERYRSALLVAQQSGERFDHDSGEPVSWQPPLGHALHEPVHANDLWIAASAVHIDAPLLITDAVFDGVPGLTLHR